MLGVASHFLRYVHALVAGILPVLLVGLALAAFTWNRDAVFFGGNVYFTDGDCYARMTRVRILQENPLAPVRHHDFENFPEGTSPHTTAPLDYLIAGVAAVLKPFAGNPLADAGAWISPVLGLATLCVLVFWGRSFAYGNAPLLLLAVSPIVSHGFLLGRPDHQSLLMFLMTISLVAEVGIWKGKSWGMLSAAAWALGLWVSLFEPLILVVAVLAARLASGRLRVSRNPIALFAGILLIALVTDGFRVEAFDTHFSRWALNIGELRHGSPAVLFSWAGWLVIPAPLILGWRFFRSREPICLLFACLLVPLIGLSLFHLRWGYFLALVFAMSLPWVLPAFRWRAAGWGIFVLSLWPVAAAWEQTLYPDDEGFRARAESVADEVALRDAAVRLRDLPRHGVIAPWWFSPAIVWWSGQPCVAGTSHQSLPGIADTAEFFLSEGTGRKILERREAGYIFSYEPDRVAANSAQILGRGVPSNPLARRLHDQPHSAEFPLLYANRFFKVFQAPVPAVPASEPGG
ncbi:MAG: hypothetical protein WCQ16_11460 [Verrucomicrobiae bacterium]